MTHRILFLAATGLLACQTLLAQPPATDSRQLVLGPYEYSAEELARGVQLPVDFPENPFCEAFDRVDAAVAAKQAFETTQVKKVFHGRQGQTDFEKAVVETEAQRAPLAAAIARAMTPVTHTITITDERGSGLDF